jgi:hypothetical protein
VTTTARRPFGAIAIHSGCSPTGIGDPTSLPVTLSKVETDSSLEFAVHTSGAALALAAPTQRRAQTAVIAASPRALIEELLIGGPF